MDNDIIVCPELISIMLNDMGFSSPDVREATREYCLEYLEDDDEISFGDLNVIASGFADGYEACLEA